jgi:RNA polymerase sigma factor (sigma-70 family)
LSRHRLVSSPVHPFTSSPVHCCFKKKGEFFSTAWDNPPLGGDISTYAAENGEGTPGAAMPELDAQLLAELLERHGPALKLYARQWCQATDDVVQQALIDLAGSRDCPANPAAWLFTAVRHRAISAGRAQRRRTQHEETAARQWFDRRRDQHETAQAAADALAELPLADREVVIAHLWGRLTFEEIAGLVGASSSTAQRRYEAAIGRLKDKLNDASKEKILPSTNLESQI